MRLTPIFYSWLNVESIKKGSLIHCQIDQLNSASMNYWIDLLVSEKNRRRAASAIPESLIPLAIEFNESSVVVVDGVTFPAAATQCRDQQRPAYVPRRFEPGRPGHDCGLDSGRPAVGPGSDPGSGAGHGGAGCVAPSSGRIAYCPENVGGGESRPQRFILTNSTHLAQPERNTQLKPSIQKYWMQFQQFDCGLIEFDYSSLFKFKSKQLSLVKYEQLRSTCQIH